MVEMMRPPGTRIAPQPAAQLADRSVDRERRDIAVDGLDSVHVVGVRDGAIGRRAT